MDFYHVDFFLPDYNLSIQADSIYWHGGCSECNISNKLNARQIFQQTRDKACICYHKFKKINLLRICECKIKNEEKLNEVINKTFNSIIKGKKVYEFKTK